MIIYKFEQEQNALLLIDIFKLHSSKIQLHTFRSVKVVTIDVINCMSLLSVTA